MSSPPLRPRSLVYPVLVLAVLGFFGCGEAQPPAPASDQDDPGVQITHGPILGRISESHVGVWARTSIPGEYQIFYGKSPNELTTSITIETRWDRDNAGWGFVDDLDSDTKYFYELTTSGRPTGDEARSGTFHTLPAPGDRYDASANPDGLYNFRFEFACGNNQNLDAGSAFGPELPTYQTMLRELVSTEDKSRIDFAILNGDWLYEDDDARQYDAQSWMRQVSCPTGRMPLIVQNMPNIVGVWENYKLYLSRGKPMAAFHRSVPSYFTFDDHELVNDLYGSGEPGRVDRRAVFRDIGTRAWYDYLGWSNEVETKLGVIHGTATLRKGSDVLYDPDAQFDAVDFSRGETLHVHWGTKDAGVMKGADDKEGGHPNAGVYEVVEKIDDDRLRIRPPARADSDDTPFSIGRLSYWRKRVSNADFFFIDTRTYREMHDTSNRTKDISMLGAAQKEWLRLGMKTSTADFLFVVSSVNFSIPHIGGTGSAPGMLSNKDDAWTAFLKEREELIRFWDTLGKPVMVLTGDLHNSFAVKVSDRVWEFASGPHNSVNHPAQSEGDRPPNGPYNSFGRNVDIRWSTYITNDTPNKHRTRPVYTVVQMNNVFRNDRDTRDVWVAYDRPHVVVQFYDGLTGDLLYAQPVAR